MNQNLPSPRIRRGASGDEIIQFPEVIPLGERMVHSDPPVDPPSEGSYGLLALLGALWRRRLLVLSLVAAGVSLSVFGALQEVPSYRATTTLEIQARETQIIQGAGVDPATIADAEFLGTQIALLQSRALAERVAEEIGLVSDPNFVNPSDSRDVRLTAATNAVLEGLTVNSVRGARIIEITVVGNRPADTARIANAVAENFIQMNLDRRYNATSYARQFVEERLATTKQALEDTERQLVEYSKQKQILDLSSVGGSEIGSSLDASSLVALNAALTEAQNARISAEQDYREAVSNPNAGDLYKSAPMQTLKASKAQLVSEYSQKLSIYKPEYPEMLALSERIDAVNADIEQERVNYRGSLEAAYRSSLAREQALANRVAELKVKVIDLKDRSIDYNILMREADTLRAQYDALLQRYKEVSILNGVGSSQVSVLDRAQAPALPFEPNLSSAITRAIILSLMIAILLTLIVEFLDDTIKTPDDVSRKLGLRILGVIPKIKASQTIGELLKDPKSPISEAFSSARTAVHFAIMPEGAKTILITANKTAEGKSSSTLALGSAFAAVGLRVLIIDADLRRPAFSYDQEGSIGLAGMLTENAHLQQQIIAGPVPNLFLLPAGKLPPNPAELLGSTKIVQLIREASEAFDLVLVDSPPAQPYSDAQSLSAVCDVTVVVVQSGAVHRQTAKRTLERLQSSNARIAGCILTKFDNKRFGYGNSYGYGYQEYEALTRKRLKPSATSSRRQISHFKDGAAAPPDFFD